MRIRIRIRMKMSRIRNTEKWLTKKEKNASFQELNVLSEELETCVLGSLIKDCFQFNLLQDIVEQEEVIEDDFDIIHDSVLGSDTLSKRLVCSLVVSVE